MAAVIIKLPRLQSLSDAERFSAHKNPRITGIIYFRRISDNRLSSEQLKSLKSFIALCGQEAAPNILMLTTMWDKPPTPIQRAREKEFKDDFVRREAALKDCEFKQLHKPKDPLEQRWYASEDIVQSAREIVQRLLENVPSKLAAGNEMAATKGSYKQTTVGRDEKKNSGFRGFVRGIFGK